MKLFDILGGKVVIHENALAIPAFKAVWDLDSQDKSHATKALSYIVFKNKWDSPYVLSLTPNLLEPTLKKQFFDDTEYKLTVEETIAEQEYKTLQDTRTLQMLTAIRGKLDSFTEYYQGSLGEDLDEKKIEKYLAGFGKVKDAYLTMDFLEKAVKAGEMDVTKVKGDAKINPFELPNR